MTVEDLPECFEINVGGFLYTVHKPTLADSPPGKLRAFATGEADDVVFDVEGRPFFDADGVAFEAVLSFLRHGVAVVPRDALFGIVRKTLEFFFDAPPTPMTERQIELTSAQGMISFKTLFLDTATPRFLRRLRKLEPADTAMVNFKASDILWHLSVPHEDTPVTLIVTPGTPMLGPKKNADMASEDVKWFLHALDLTEATTMDLALVIRQAFRASYVTIVKNKPDEGYMHIRVAFLPETTFATSMRAALNEQPPPPEEDWMPPPQEDGE